MIEKEIRKKAIRLSLENVFDIILKLKLLNSYSFYKNKFYWFEMKEKCWCLDFTWIRIKFLVNNEID